jgi:membrane protein
MPGSCRAGWRSHYSGDAMNDKAPSAGWFRTSRLLAAAGLVALGYFMKRAVDMPRSGARRVADRILRAVLFQSKRESAQTASLPASSVIAEVSRRFYWRFINHSVMSVAAASAFYMVLAIFPGLAALVALYGFLGDPADIATFISSMPNFVPLDVIQLVQDFLRNLIARPQANLNAFIISFSIAMWSAMSATKSLIESLNVVYECRESRSFLWINVLAILMTLSLLAFMVIAINIMILPVWSILVQQFGDYILRLRWLVLLFGMQVLLSALYYFGPCGHKKHWRLLTAGASLAALAWVGMSMLFSYYLTNFANYSITYGSLGVAAVFMTWLWLTAMIVLAGAEFDASLGDLGAREK